MSLMTRPAIWLMLFQMSAAATATSCRTVSMPWLKLSNACFTLSNA